ncbi:putative muramidase [Xylaria palmicola]|nr:putative muramidase [Xylaria palmicola]
MAASAPDASAQALNRESDRIKAQMIRPALRDKVWGFVVYRCAGRNEAAWQRMIDLLNDTVAEGLKDENREDLLPYHHLRTVDDDGATTHAVRDHFHQWVPQDIQSRLPEGSTASAEDLESSGATSSPRYEYCLLVDDLCLESLDYPSLNSPIVKLVARHWGPLDEVERQAPIHPDFHDGQTEYAEEDVGWMYMPVRYCLDRYDALIRSDWEDVYMRPPYIEGNETEDEFPGHWRRNIGQ